MVDVTGSVEFGAQVALEAFAHGKSVVLLNAEVDATIGPILQLYARKNGVILSACDGDEPGAPDEPRTAGCKGLGLIPRVMGNVKGLQDPYRNPTTQQGFAEQWGQNPAMVTSFADGSKISFEQAIVANATGFKVRSARHVPRRRVRRVDHGHRGALRPRRGARARRHRRLHGWATGIKVFVLAEHEDPKQRHYLELYKMGEGPLYPFWIPYHLVHFETPNSIARVVAVRRQARAAARRPGCRGLRRREAGPRGGRGARRLRHVHDVRRGGQHRGDERAAVICPRASSRAAGCGEPSPRTQVLTYDDVELPKGRLADRLRAEQYAHFRGDNWLSDLLAADTPVLAP